MSDFFKMSGSDTDIVISTRVRLARNLAGIPFGNRLASEDAERLIAEVSRPIVENPVFSERFTLKKYGKEPSGELRGLVEKHLVSKEFAASGLTRAALISEDGGISVMINEEDHIRLQAIGSGLCIEECLEAATSLDRVIEQGIGKELGGYAFDSRLGYLTCCPTNIGTGMRVSVMLHLPALAASGSDRLLSRIASRFGLAVRGFYGEGTAATGDIFQISNRVTLGYDESELAQRLKEAVNSLIREERARRKEEYEASPLAFEDRVHRSAAVLSSARLISTDEAMQLLSDYRTGVASGILKGDMDRINALLWAIQPASLGGNSAASRDASRAELLRREINYE